MRRKLLWATMLALPLAIGGFVYAGVQSAGDAQSNDAGALSARLLARHFLAPSAAL